MDTPTTHRDANRGESTREPESTVGPLTALGEPGADQWPKGTLLTRLHTGSPEGSSWGPSRPFCKPPQGPKKADSITPDRQFAHSVRALSALTRSAATAYEAHL